MNFQSEIAGVSPRECGAPQSVWLALREIGRVRLTVLTVLLLGHLFYSVFLVVPGHFVSDEGIYHQMAHALAENGSLGLWPEYAEFPSPELRTWNHVTGKEGGLQSQYPYLHPVLAWPFYKLAGFRGLFAMNAVAYVLVAGLCFALANRLWRDGRIAADSVILLTLTTYAWQYSQEVWPQTLASAFLLAGCLFAIRADQSDRAWDALASGFAAGFVVGLGAGVRVDVIFLVPALLLPLLYNHTPRWRVIASVMVGLLPGLLLLSLTNYAKFGTLQPISYGRESGTGTVSAYIPPIIAAGALFAMTWIATRESVWPMVVRHRIAITGITVALMGALLLLVPSVGQTVWRMFSGSLTLVTDLSLIDLSQVGLGVTRGPAGSIIYADTVKKALLQSLPWLPLTLFAMTAIPHCRARLLAHAVPVLAVLAFLAVFGWFTWHGGYAFNLRYFVPLLPILAIYGAQGIHMLGDGKSRELRFAAVVIAFISSGFWLFMLFRDTETAAMEAVILNLPLVLAAGLGVLLFALVVRPGVSSIRRAAFLATFACFAWSFDAALLLDLPRSQFIRQYRYETGQFLASHVAPDTLLFSSYDPASFVLTEIPGARNAWVTMDDYEDAPAIQKMATEANRPIMAFFNNEEWAEFRQRGMVDGFFTTRVAESTDRTLYRLQPSGIPSDGQAK